MLRNNPHNTDSNGQILVSIETNHVKVVDAPSNPKVIVLDCFEPENPSSYSGRCVSYEEVLSEPKKFHFESESAARLLHYNNKLQKQVEDGDETESNGTAETELCFPQSSDITELASSDPGQNERTALKDIAKCIAPLFEKCVVDPIEKQRLLFKKRQLERKLSNHLLVLQQARLEAESGKDPEARLHRKMTRLQYGEMGVALFSPLDAAHQNTCFSAQSSIQDEDSSTDVEEEEELCEDGVKKEEEQDLELTVLIKLECPKTLKFSPRILTPSLMIEIQNRLPASVQLQSWIRLFSTSRDGDSFTTFLNRVSSHSNTVLAIRTTKNEIFGGYSDSAWRRQKDIDGRYYGTGQSFLFFVDKKSSVKGNMVKFYRWTGENNYNQLCHVGDGKIAMGGGGMDGSFGFCVEDFFTHGSTGACDTYGNPPLVDDHYFEVVDSEVYGFSYDWY